MDACAATNFQFSINLTAYYAKPSFPFTCSLQIGNWEVQLNSLHQSSKTSSEREEGQSKKQKRKTEGKFKKKKKSDTVCEGGLRRWFPGK